MATTDLILRLQGEAKDLRNSLTKTSAGLTKIQNEIDTLSKKGRKASRVMADGFVKASKRINRAFTGMAGKLAAVMGVAGVAGVFVKATQAAAEFEKSLAKVSTLLSGDVKTQIKAFKGQILDLSKSTGESVNVLSDSLFTIISATVKGSESVAGANELLAATSKLAVAGFTDSATATEALTTVLNSYNLTTEDSVSVSDKLTKIAALANTTFGEMAPQLGKVASITAAAGISIEELGFMFASLTAGGRKVNMAMTDMRAIVNGLTKPSKALAAIYKEAGITSGAAAVKQMGVVKVLELIKEKTGGTFENIQKVIEQQEAWAGAAILLGERLDSAGKVVDQIGNSAGATEIAYQKMAKTFTFLSGQFKQTVNAVLIKVGEKILPVLITKLNEMSAWVDKNSAEIVSFFGEAFETFVGFAKFILDHGKKIAIILASIWAVGSIINFVDWVKKSIVVMAAYGAVVSAVGVGVTGLKKAWVILQAVMSASPIFLVATAFVAVGAAIKALVENWKELVDFFNKTPELMSNNLRKMAQIIKNMPDVQRETLIKNFENDPRLNVLLGKEGAKKQADELRTRVDLLRAAEGIRSGAEKATDVMNKKFRNLMSRMFKGGAFDEDVVPGGGGGKGKQDKLDDERMKEILAARTAAIQRIRALEIAAMEEVEAIRAKLEDKTEAINKNKLTTNAQKKEEIVLLERQSQVEINKIVKKRDDDTAKAQEDRAAEALVLADEYRMDAKNRHKIAISDSKKRIEIAKREARETAAIFEDAGIDAFESLFAPDKFKNAGWFKGMAEAFSHELEGVFSDWTRGLWNTVGNELSDIIQKRLIHSRLPDDVGDALGKAVGGALQTVWEGFTAVGKSFMSMFSNLYEKAYSQIKELMSLAFESAAVGEKLLILTDADRAKREEDIGRPLTDDEARSMAQAMTPEELANLQLQGRIGGFSEVGVETPQDRMQQVLDTMTSWWENLAQNLGPILSWLTNEAVPTLIAAIVKNVPAIIKALNDSWRESFPMIMRDIVPTIINLIVEQLPEVMDSFFSGLMEGLLQLMEKLPEIIVQLIQGIIETLVRLIAQIIEIAVVELPKMMASSMLAVFTKDFWKDVVWGMLKELGEGLKDIFSDMWKQMKTLGDLGGKTKRWFKKYFHDGGMIQDALYAHAGMFISPRLSADEVPIIAQVGEAVLNRQAVQNVGGEAGVNAMNNGGSSDGGTVNNFFEIDHWMSEDTPEVIDRMIDNGLKAGNTRVASAVRGDKRVGFTSRRS